MHANGDVRSWSAAGLLVLVAAGGMAGCHATQTGVTRPPLPPMVIAPADSPAVADAPQSPRPPEPTRAPTQFNKPTRFKAARRPAPPSEHEPVAPPAVTSPAFYPSRADLVASAQSLLRAGQNAEGLAIVDWLLSADAADPYARCMRARLVDHLRVSKDGLANWDQPLGPCRESDELPSFSLRDIRFEDAILLLEDISLRPISVSWTTLGRHGIKADTPVVVDVPAGEIGSALERILQAVSPPEDRLGYAFNHDTDAIEIELEAELKRRTAVTDVYAVADLLTAGANETSPSSAAAIPAPLANRPVRTISIVLLKDPCHFTEDELIDAISRDIDPTTWVHAGGIVGTLNVRGGQLHVRQTPENHQAIAKWLEKARQRVRIPFDVRIIRCSRKTVEQAVAEWRLSTPVITAVPSPAPWPARQAGPVRLDQDMERRLLDAVAAEKAAEILRTQQFITFSGQQATVGLRLTQPYTSAYKRQTTADGNPQYSPINGTVSTGLELTVGGIASDDGKSATLFIQSTHTWVAETEIVPWPDGPDVLDLKVQRIRTESSQTIEIYTAPEDATTLIAGPADQASPADEGEDRQYFILVRTSVIEPHEVRELLRRTYR